jgi:hypothetical protein
MLLKENFSFAARISAGQLSRYQPRNRGLNNQSNLTLGTVARGTTGLDLSVLTSAPGHNPIS